MGWCRAVARRFNPTDMNVTFKMCTRVEPHSRLFFILLLSLHPITLCGGKCKHNCLPPTDRPTDVLELDMTVPTTVTTDSAVPASTGAFSLQLVVWLCMVIWHTNFEIDWQLDKL